jgi:hypothetical protein
MVNARWIPVSEGLPRSGIPVLAAYLNVLGKARVVRAEYAPPKTLPLAEDCDDEGGEYDEETDTYYCSPGWYESNDNEEVHWRITDEVTHWQPLPAHPSKEAPNAS